MNRLYFISILFIALTACDLYTGSSQTKSLVGKSKYEGMIKIHSSGETFEIGSSKESAPDDAKPGMRVSFQYDFELGITEVSESEFKVLVGYSPRPDKDSDLPVSYVNWYEAAYYCNSKSKSLGLDTVYQYVSLKTNSEGKIEGMDGLNSNLQAEGFRLPTEAEWEYIAKLNSSNPIEDYAWYLRNSDNKLHPNAALSGGKFGIYDLQGNLMEWVHDWKGNYQGVGRLEGKEKAYGFPTYLSQCQTYHLPKGSL